MATFGQRLVEYRRYMGLIQADLMEILDKSRQTVSAYEVAGRTPSYGDLVEFPNRLGASLDWLTGLSSGPMWTDDVQEFRLWLRANVTSLVSAEDVHTRMVAVTNLIREHLPVARQDWFLAGMLGLHSDKGMKGNVALLEQWRSGRGPNPGVLKRTLQRLSDWTGLPEMWLMLGDPSYLQPVDLGDLGEWANVVTQYIRLGHTPDEHHALAEYIDQLIKQQRRV